MCTDEQHDATQARLKDIARLLTPRPYIDTSYQVSDTQGFILDYKGMKHLYIFSAATLVFTLPGIGVYTVPAGTWVSLDFRQGWKLFTNQGLTAPVNVLVRATDEVLSADLESSASSPVFTEDFIRGQIALGNGYTACTGILPSATNTNVYLMLELLANNIAKNVFIYNCFMMCINAQADQRINLSLSATTDTTNAANDMKANNQVFNQGTGANAPSGTSLTSVLSSATGFTGPNAAALLGGLRGPQLAVGANNTINLLQNGSGIYIPKNTLQNVLFYSIMAAIGQKGSITAEWIEWL